MPNTEKRFKKGEIICRPKEMVMSMYNILYGSVGIYFDYGTPEQVDVVTLREGDFFNVISFLESRQRNTTAVALENTIVSEITYDNFSGEARQDHEPFAAHERPDAPDAEGLCGHLPRAGAVRRQGEAGGGAR